MLGGDVGGFPNGRRVGDDVLDIVLRAVAGRDAADAGVQPRPNNTLGDGVNGNDVPYLTRLPVPRRAPRGQPVSLARLRSRPSNGSELACATPSRADRAGSAIDTGVECSVTPESCLATSKSLRPVPVIAVRPRRAPACARSARPTRAYAAMPRRLGTPGGPSTSRDGLARTVAGLERRIADEPGNGVAAARLADVLMRQARVASNPGLAVRAEDVLRAALDDGPSYESTRMLGTVLLSQHRFRDAIEIAERARAIEPADAWNYGVLGDA